MMRKSTADCQRKVWSITHPPSEDCRGSTIRKFFRKCQAFKKYDAAIRPGLEPQGHFRMKTMPSIDFHLADGDLSRCSIERTVLRLKIDQDSFMGLFAAVADRRSTK